MTTNELAEFTSFVAALRNDVSDTADRCARQQFHDSRNYFLAAVREMDQALDILYRLLGSQVAGKTEHDLVAASFLAVEG